MCVRVRQAAANPFILPLPTDDFLCLSIIDRGHIDPSFTDETSVFVIGDRSELPRVKVIEALVLQIPVVKASWLQASLKREKLHLRLERTIDHLPTIDRLSDAAALRVRKERKCIFTSLHFIVSDDMHRCILEGAGGRVHTAPFTPDEALTALARQGGVCFVGDGSGGFSKSAPGVSAMVEQWSGIIPVVGLADIIATLIDCRTPHWLGEEYKITYQAILDQVMVQYKAEYDARYAVLYSQLQTRPFPFPFSFSYKETYYDFFRFRNTVYVCLSLVRRREGRYSTLWRGERVPWPASRR